MESLRSRLKKCQPYFIKRDLIPKMFFKIDDNYTENLIFEYTFLNHLSDLSISVRMGYSRQTIGYKLNNIIKKNHAIIEEFLANN